MPFSNKKTCACAGGPRRPRRPRQERKPCGVIPPYRDGLVLRGYDVVEYHNLPREAAGVQGSPEYQYVYENEGAKYKFHFISRENLNLFQSNTEKYFPQFGGFCSWGFANEWGVELDGKTFGDPEVPPDCQECVISPTWVWTEYVMGPPADTEYGWTIYGGRLYFNINSSYRRLWEANPDVFIARGQDRWTKYYGDKVGPLNVASYPWNWRESTSLTEEQVRCLQ